MRKHIIVFVCLAMLFASAGLHAQATGQGGFTGPMVFGQHPVSFSGQGVHGFSGPSMPVSVSQVVTTFPNKAHAILTGNIVQHLGSDRYLFRDSSGDVVVKIKHDRWWGLSVGPADLVEIGGELKREKNGMIKYFDAKSIRRSS